jgi:hypothetical protein
MGLACSPPVKLNQFVISKINRKRFSMPKIYRPFTNHESDEIWGRIYLKEAGTIAREKTTLSTDFRLFLLGLQRVSNQGHSPFSAGEISRLLTRRDGDCYSPRYINSQIKVLINAGLLSPASNSRCLVYPRELIGLKTDKKQVALCPEHGTHSSWSSHNNDWATDYLPEAQLVTAIDPIEEEIVPDWEDEFAITLGSYTS